MPAIGPLNLVNDPEDGQLQTLELVGLPIGLAVQYEPEPSNSTVSPAQVGGLTSPPPPDGLSGHNIHSVAVTGPVGAELVYADNAGGSGESSANVGDQTATFLSGVDGRGLDSLAVTGPENVEMHWGADTGEAPTSTAGSGPLALGLLEGNGGGGGLESISTGGLLGAHVEFVDADDQTFPIDASQDPANASLLDNAGDRGVNEISVDGVGEIVGGNNPVLGEASDIPLLGPTTGLLQSALGGGVGDLPAVGDLGALPALGEVGGLLGSITSLLSGGTLPAVGDLGALPVLGDTDGLLGVLTDLPLLGDIGGGLPILGDLGGGLPIVGDLGGGLPILGDLGGLSALADLENLL